MISPLPEWLQPIDHAVLWSLVPLAVIFLISGLDDLAVDFAWLWLRTRSKGVAAERPTATQTRRIAILVPLWHEHEVIARMLAHNLAAIRYPDFHIFAGAYPNDAETQNAVQSVAAQFPNVHLAVCPHDGPTSKADCLNWIYQNIGLFEEQTGTRFDILATHDAEDLIHPDELTWINDYAEKYDFIQIPVLALPTPLRAITHGVYCDEFAENHTRDMIVRSQFGCFVPGAGVGTGYRREALEKLAAAEENRIFEPAALTEDYENGLRLHRLGCSQIFVPIGRAETGGDYVVTREFFPQRWTSALKQRTRWVMGIALQGWERIGWQGSIGDKYWFWRDRKSLIGSPLGVIANAIFCYGLVTSIWTRVSPLPASLAMATLGLQVIRIGVRMACTARIYDPRFALGVPVRIVYANALNAAATVNAIVKFAVAKLRGQPLRWLKTDHAYPTRAALLGQKRMLGEILVSSGRISEAALESALESRAEGVLIGEHLLSRKLISESELYTALSLQQGLIVIRLQPHQIPATVARALPVNVARDWRVLPYRIADGAMYIAGPSLPSPQMHQALHGFTSLEIRFCLTTPSDYERAARAFL
ncbi:MAG: glycosyl transferase family protein [Bryobacteraceae bacterium]